MAEADIAHLQHHLFSTQLQQRFSIGIAAPRVSTQLQ